MSNAQALFVESVFFVGKVATKLLYRSHAGSYFYRKNTRFGLIGQLAILKKNIGPIMSYEGGFSMFAGAKK